MFNIGRVNISKVMSIILEIMNKSKNLTIEFLFIDINVRYGYKLLTLKFFKSKEMFIGV